MQDVGKQINDVIYSLTHCNIPNYDISLLSGELMIPIEDLLYVIIELEEVHKFPIIQVIIESNFSIFTINNLSRAIQTKLNESA